MSERLTQAEEELMNIFWDAKMPLTSVEILECASGKSWSGNYIHKMLRALQKKEFIEVCGTKQYGRQYAREFSALVSREEYAARLLEYQGMGMKSLAKVALAFVKKEGKQSKEEQEKLLEDLEALIKELKEET